MVCRLAVILLLLAFVSPAAARAQDPKSPALAKQLAAAPRRQEDRRLCRGRLRRMPAPIVAALYFPGTQLLVVSAKYAAPQMLDDLLAKKDYRGVYIELSSASIAPTKVFVMDTFADGLMPKPNGGSGRRQHRARRRRR